MSNAPCMLSVSWTLVSVMLPCSRKSNPVRTIKRHIFLKKTRKAENNEVIHTYLNPFQLCWQPPLLRHEVAEHWEWDQGPAEATEPHAWHERSNVTSRPTKDERFELMRTKLLLNTLRVTQPLLQQSAKSSRQRLTGARTTVSPVDRSIYSNNQTKKHPYAIIQLNISMLCKILYKWNSKVKIW